MWYDRELLAIFAGEQSEHILRMRALAGSLPGAKGEARETLSQEALRRAHTLKGAARAVGLEGTEQLAHHLENLLSGAAGAAAKSPQEVTGAIHRVLDAMEDILAAALEGRAEPDVSNLLGQSPAPAADASPAQPAAPSADLPPTTSPTAPAAEFLRVSGATVDELIAASSQLVAMLSSQSSSLQASAMTRAGSALDEFEALQRACLPFLRAHEDNIDAAPLRECLNFATREFRALAAETRASFRQQEQRAWALRRQVANVHENAIKVRMIPVESVFGAFGAMVRQLAHEDGKQVIFTAEGFDVQADRIVLQSLKDPVMHLLRNAVSHGIESPQERIAAGKAPEGAVRLKFETDGNRLLVSVEDDGKGLDNQAVREHAIAAGLLNPNAVDAGQRLDELLFHPGFSTSEAVTSISGRGLGLSIVKETADRLHGKVEVRALRPSGLGITIAVGLSISTQQVLVVSAAGRKFMIPTRYITNVARARMSELRQAGGREVLPLAGINLPVARLSDLLGLANGSPAEEAEPDPWIYLAALSLENQTVGLIVDRVLDEQDSVIKDLKIPERAMGVSAGGVVLEDGAVALLLSPGALLGNFQTGARTPVRQAESLAETPARRILIVDDSLTTRSLEKSILEAHGFDVTVAVDGVDALDKLARASFDLVITDVTMPRMDGMQLLEEMKKRKNTASIPVIMLTSMESREDQQRGLALGADAYLIKRKFDQQELLHTVRQIL